METAFYTSSSLNEIEVKELLLRRYNNYDQILSMELQEFLEFVNYAWEKENDEKLYFRWCIALPHMAKQCDYQEFKDLLTGRNIDQRPADVIIQEIEEAHKQKGGRNGGDI